MPFWSLKNMKDMRQEMLNKNERHLVKQIRDMGFGSITIQVKDGIPCRIEEKVTSVMLGVFTGDLVP